MSIKKLYYYFFYKLYKFWDYVSYPKFWSESKASLSIIVIEIWLFFSVINYLEVFFNDRMIIIPENGKFYIVFTIFLGIIDYFIFHHKDQWKGIIEEFDQLPRKKNVIGGTIIWSIILFIIANFIFSFYLYYQN